MKATPSSQLSVGLRCHCGCGRLVLLLPVQINPFKMIASNYTDAKIREYKGKKHYELNPHVFALVR